MTRKRGEYVDKKGSFALVGLLVVIIAAGAATLFISSSDNALTGATIGIAEISGNCNISVREDILNIGHDYVCSNSDGFQIDADHITLDCQGHSITSTNQTAGFAGIRLNGRENVTIQNCYIYNFTDAIKLEGNANNNTLYANFLYNNSDGVDINNASANTLYDNTIDQNTFCGVNVTTMDNGALGAASNIIYNNKLLNSSGGFEACSDAASFNYWYVNRTCGTTNIIGGTCLGGNSWSSYEGIDTTGDGLGDTILPHLGGNIATTAVGDIRPLVTSCGTIPAVFSEDATCGDITLNSTSGEGIAITKSNVVFTCNATTLNGNVASYAEDMRGIEIRNVDNVTVIGCEIYNFTYGVFVQSSTNVNLINLTVRDNNFTGIYVGPFSKNVTISNSVVKDTGSNMQKYGVWLKSASPSVGSNVINFSEFVNNTVSGVYLSDTSQVNTIHNNYFWGNSLAGIFVNDSDSNSFFSNNISNSTFGISVTESSVTSVGTRAAQSQNRITNTSYGYYLIDGSSTSSPGISGYLYDNTYGVFVTGSSVEIEAGVDAHNNTVGIYAGSSPLVSVRNATIAGSQNHAVYVENSTLTSIDPDLHIYNNSVGFYFTNANNSRLSILSDGSYFTLHNNTVNLEVFTSRNITFSDANILGGDIGVNFTSSYNNTFHTNNVSGASLYNLYLNQSEDNLLYNNIIDNTTGGVDAYDDMATNYWNTTYSASTNIYGYTGFGGNWWSTYQGSGEGDTDGDGIGEDPSTYTLAGGGNRDFLPLTTPTISCTTITESRTFVTNLSSNGSCIVVGADGITLDFAGFSLVGNGSGIGINISSRQNVTVLNANILNFSTAIYINPSSGINITKNNISESDIGIELIETNSSHVTQNRIFSNALGVNISQSYDNFVYDNNFTNTQNAKDDGSTNYWNTSYTAGTNILLGPVLGGNFWSDYEGKDNGAGSSPYNNNTDSIGDTRIPYNTLITGGDYLPLTRDNGTTNPGCTTITSDTTLTGDITCTSGNGVTIAANSLTLNCNGYSIVGDGTGSGVYVGGYNDVTITNCNITNFYYGVRVQDAQRTTIGTNNTLSSNDFYGIYLYQADHTVAINNSISSDNNGVYAISSYNTTIANNDINLQRKFYGVYLFESDLVTLENNTIWDNYHGVYAVNSSQISAENNNITNNDIYNLFLHKGSSDASFTQNTLDHAQQAVRVKQNSNDIRFTNNALANNTAYGFYLTDASGINISNGSITNNTVNLYATNSPNIRVVGTSISDAPTSVRILDASDNAHLEQNTISASSEPALEINESSAPVIINNTITQNAYLYMTSSAIVRDNNTIEPTFRVTDADNINITNNNLNETIIISSESFVFNANTLRQLNASSASGATINTNTIRDHLNEAFILSAITSSTLNANTIENTTGAIKLLSSSSSNTLTRNWLADNAYGLNTTSSSNTIYDNYFSNTLNVIDSGSNTYYTSYSCASANIVGGPCVGGNFYSDYYGLDNGANSREEGDGIGDQPATHTVVSGTTDTYPLVLYVARQYYAPDAPYNVTFATYSNTSGEITDGQVVPAEAQLLSYNASDGKPYFEILGFFNASNVDASTLKINTSSTRTAVNVSGVTNVEANYSVYLYHNGGFDSGAYLCANVSIDEANATCTGRINLTAIGSNNGVFLEQGDTYYKISNISRVGVEAGVAVLNTAEACGATLLHSVTLSESVSCNGTGFIVGADNLTIDFNGYALTGNGTGIGINISDFDNVTIVDAVISNFTTAIYADPAHGINITNSNITASETGIVFDQINDSWITTNYITNNTIGINFTHAFNIFVYDNYFNSSQNVNETNSSIHYNVTYQNGTNILSGAYLGGNFWANYGGNDSGNATQSYAPNVTSDGIGDTAIPYNETGMNGSDYLPLLVAAVCGDGDITGAEVCDGSEFNGLTCSDYGYSGGSLTCANSCLTINVTAACTNSTGSSGSSGGSSGGGGGGGSGSSGGGGGSAVVSTSDETCQESWTCEDWSICQNGEQTRTCYDANSCSSKLANGEVESIISSSIPELSRTCSGGVSTAPKTPQEPDPTSQDETGSSLNLTVLFSSLGALLAVGGVYSYWMFAYPPNRLRRKLKKLNPQVGKEPAQLLKDAYTGIYSSYMRLSEGHKRNFYSRIVKVRAEIEKQLKAEKHMQALFEDVAETTDLKKRKKIYLNIYENYEKLPAKVKEKYYPQIVDLREELEHGVKGRKL